MSRPTDARPRVYLMVDDGKGPRTVAVTGAARGLAMCYREDAGKANVPRRWWLVEADSADHARRTIEHAQAGFPQQGILDQAVAA